MLLIRPIDFGEKQVCWRAEELGVNQHMGKECKLLSDSHPEWRKGYKQPARMGGGGREYQEGRPFIYTYILGAACKMPTDEISRRN